MKKDFVCKGCGYYWTSKKLRGNPALCPGCRSKNIVKYLDTEEGKSESATTSATVVILVLFLFGIIFFGWLAIEIALLALFFFLVWLAYSLYRSNKK